MTAATNIVLSSPGSPPLETKSLSKVYLFDTISMEHEETSTTNSDGILSPRKTPLDADAHGRTNQLAIVARSQCM
jgi:hypothetical protein